MQVNMPSALTGQGTIDRWGQIVSQLSANPVDPACYPEILSGSPRHCTAPTHFDWRRIRIKVIERPSSSTYVISWRDPTLCFYGYQQWRLRIAKSFGRCALSGRTIEPGDKIYCPVSEKGHVLNASAMILSKHLKEAARASFDE